MKCVNIIHFKDLLGRFCWTVSKTTLRISYTFWLRKHKNNRLSQNHRFLNNSFTETNKKLKECVDVWLLIVCVQITEIDFIWLCCAMRNITIMGKIYAKPHTIVKQICFPNGNALSLSLFSLLKNWKHDEVWGSAEILPSALFSQDRLPDELISAETTCIKRIAFFFCLLWNFMGVLY